MIYSRYKLIDWVPKIQTGRETYKIHSVGMAVRSKNRVFHKEKVWIENKNYFVDYFSWGNYGLVLTKTRTTS